MIFTRVLIPNIKITCFIKYLIIMVTIKYYKDDSVFKKIGVNINT